MSESSYELKKKRKISVAGITNTITVCEDCGRKWTATLAEVPVTMFIKDLDEYYKYLNNNLLEAVEPPMVLCVFRPSDKDVWDTEVTLSCVAPRRDSPYHWHINHKHNGPAAASGCQIIPWTYNNNLVSKSEDGSSEQDTVIIKEETKVEGNKEMMGDISSDPLADDKEVKPDVNSITVSVSKKNSDLTTRPLRECLIQLLAVRGYKKLEIRNKIYKKDCKLREQKLQFAKCLMSVSTVIQVHELQSDFWGEVKEDWPYYTDDEKGIVRQNKAEHMSQVCKETAESNNRSKQQNPDLIEMPLRERIIQLLAVRDYKQLEVLNRIHEEGCEEAKECIITCLISVSTVCLMSDSTEISQICQLRTNLWEEVKDDWPLYTDEEKFIVRKNKAQHVSPHTGGNNCGPKSQPLWIQFRRCGK